MMDSMLQNLSIVITSLTMMTAIPGAAGIFVTSSLLDAVHFYPTGTAGIVAYYTFFFQAPLLDLAFSLGDLQARGGPSYIADGPWPGSQGAALTSIGDSSGRGQYFRVNALNLGAMSKSTGFSICTWFVFDATTDGARIFDFGTGAGSSVLSLSRSWTQLMLQYYCDYGTNGYSFPNPIVNGQWRHVCVVNQGSSWSVYDNGVYGGSGFCSLNNVLLTSNFIGRSNYYYHSLLIGRVDEFRIYKEPLSSSAVFIIYSNRYDLPGICLQMFFSRFFLRYGTAMPAFIGTFLIDKCCRLDCVVLCLATGASACSVCAPGTYSALSGKCRRFFACLSLVH
jgi:hypothetical protein